MTKRTDQEILDRIKEVEPNDIFGFMRVDLLRALPFKIAKPLLKDGGIGLDDADWVVDDDPLHEIRQYMAFAWEKANNNRGISAGRSISHMESWLWLAGEDEFLAKIDFENDYCFYGKPILRAICEHLDIDWKALDDDRWANDEESKGVKADDVPTIGASE